jgi:serine/threonine protein kinase
VSGTTDLLGELLEGRYRIDSPIARGGMSTVYRGLDTRLDRPVAVKVMTRSSSPASPSRPGPWPG